MNTPAAMNPKAAFRRDRVFEFLITKQVDDLDLSHGTALYLEDISVNFDGFQAINGLNFYVNTGELRCLIGPNGAGKTTLMDIVTGKTRPDMGTAWFGQKINLLRMDEAEIAQAGSLSHGQKQWLEIGMLIMRNPVLLLVDEPAAGMTHQEMDRTVELLSSLAGEHAIVVVEHDMDFVRALNSPVTVLHQGSVLAEGSMSDIQTNADVMRVYLGTEDASC